MTEASDADTIRELKRGNDRLSKKYDEVFTELEEFKRGLNKFKENLQSAAKLSRKPPDADEKYEGEYRRHGMERAQFAVWSYLKNTHRLSRDWWRPFEKMMAALWNADIGVQDPLTDAKFYDSTEGKRRSGKSIQKMVDDARLVWMMDIIISAVDAKEFVEWEGAPMDRASASDLEDEGTPDLLRGEDAGGFFRDGELAEGQDAGEEPGGDEADDWLRTNEEPGGFSGQGIKRVNIEVLTTGKKETVAMELIVKASGLTGDPALQMVKQLKNLRKNANKMPSFQAVQYNFIKEKEESFLADHRAKGYSEREAYRMLMDMALSPLRADGLAAFDV